MIGIKCTLQHPTNRARFTHRDRQIEQEAACTISFTSGYGYEPSATRGSCCSEHQYGLSAHFSIPGFRSVSRYDTLKSNCNLHALIATLLTLPDFYHGIRTSDHTDNYLDSEIVELEENDMVSMLKPSFSYSFSIPAVAEPLIYSILGPQEPYTCPSTKSKLRSALLKNLKPSLLERYDGEFEYCIDRLLGPNAADAFFEFIIFVMHAGANTDGYDINLIRLILNWLLRQNESLSRVIFDLPFATTQAFLDYVILRCVESHASW